MSSTAENCNLYVKAANFAAEFHKHQRRKYTFRTPYINHPLGVAYLITEKCAVDKATLAAAVLHDVIEDTVATYEDVKEAFGSEIADIVQEVTDDMSLPSKRRKEIQVIKAPSLSTPAKLIKIADKICNIRDMSAVSNLLCSKNYKKTYYDWAEKVFIGCKGIEVTLDKLFEDTLLNARIKLQ